MNEIYKDKLMVLRQRIPIGLRDGLLLIEKVNGDLEKAEKQFKDEMVTLAINKTGVTLDFAISHLIKSSFDISLAIKLPPEVYSFMVIMEWLQNEDWEGYGYALSFHLDLVTEHIRNQLALPDLANTLQHANNIKTLVFSKYETAKEIQNYINAINELRDHEEYQKCEEDFKRQRPLLLERLYEFVKSNITHYP